MVSAVWLMRTLRTSCASWIRLSFNALPTSRHDRNWQVKARVTFDLLSLNWSWELPSSVTADLSFTSVQTATSRDWRTDAVNSVWNIASCSLERTGWNRCCELFQAYGYADTRSVAGSDGPPQPYGWNGSFSSALGIIPMHRNSESKWGNSPKADGNK